jgi:hypothetical protein
MSLDACRAFHSWSQVSKPVLASAMITASDIAIIIERARDPACRGREAVDVNEVQKWALWRDGPVLELITITDRPCCVGTASAKMARGCRPMWPVRLISGFNGGPINIGRGRRGDVGSISKRRDVHD